MGFDLPNGWEMVALKDVIFFQEGPGLRKHQFKETGIPFLNIRTLTNERVKLSLCQYIDPEEVYAKYRHFLLKSDDIVASSSGTLGKTAIIYEEDLPLMLNTSIIRFRPHNENFLTRNFIHLFLKSQYFLSQAQTASTGSAQINFGPSHLEKMWFILPPLNEQKRIVAKIEALQQHHNAAKTELEAIKPLLSQFRQSVLSAAFRGDLTRDWREKNPDVEPAEKLILSLKNSNPEHYLNVFPKSSSYTLPLSWSWVQLGRLGTLQGGGTPSKRNSEFWIGHIPWISAKDMKKDRINDSTDHISEDAIKKSSTKLIPKNSIIFVVRGMILNHTLPIAITDNVVTINQDLKALVPEIKEMSEYLFLVSKFVSKQILFWVKAATHGTRRLETAILKDWAIPISPLPEQQEIVKRIESLFKLADTIEEQYKQTYSQLETLNQSILAKAFKGKLVPQDPNDEPASVLLERIKAEKAKQEKPKQKAKKIPKSEIQQLNLDL